jgi:hypothetical protein
MTVVKMLFDYLPVTRAQEKGARPQVHGRYALALKLN